jgi:hypothetical protein
VTESIYDQHAEFYLNFVDRGLAEKNGLVHAITDRTKHTKQVSVGDGRS